jgi:phenolic acid decarboxylase
MASAILSFFVSTLHAAESYIGQFLYRYDGGSVYRVTVDDPLSMRWECIDGGEKGASGIERPERFKVVDNIYYATWVEKTGVSVSQVIDLSSMKVYSTIIDRADRYVLRGEIVREK